MTRNPAAVDGAISPPEKDAAAAASQTAKKQLRVLLVEDSAMDAELLELQLKRSGYAPSITRVETLEAFASELRRHSHDVVVADYNLPQFTGLDALLLLQRSGEDLPFILVSGAVGEETAVRVMKAGAHDFFLKDKLARLGSAIEREMRDTQVRKERRNAYAELEELNREHRALSICNRSLIRAESESDWLVRVCRIIVDEAGYRMCWVGYVEPGSSGPMNPVAYAGVDEGYLARAVCGWPATDPKEDPTERCAQTMSTTIVANIAEAPGTGTWRTEAAKRGYRSAIALPLHINAATTGAITIFSADSDAFKKGDIQLLTELADDLAYGVTNLRVRARHEQAREQLRALNAELEQRVVARTAELVAARTLEAEVGSRIQKMFLLDPAPRDVDGVRVAAVTVPAQKIGGDSYGFFVHRDRHCLDLFIADVMGKGVPAALLSAAVKGRFPEAMWHHMSTAHPFELPDPRDLVSFANSQIARELIELETFVTLCYARINRTTCRLDFVDCGHTGIVHFRARDRGCTILHGANLPLGVLEREELIQASVPFETGDIFVFYSDGITETRDVRGELFGTKRLTDLVRTNHHLDPEALVRTIRDEAAVFSGQDIPRDDLTCLAVTITRYEPPVARGGIPAVSDLVELPAASKFVGSFCDQATHPRQRARQGRDSKLARDEPHSRTVRVASRLCAPTAGGECVMQAGEAPSARRYREVACAGRAGGENALRFRE